MAVKPVAEVTVLPKPDDSAAEGDSMTTSRVEADAGALVWPQMCCCCGSTSKLDSIGIYSNTKFGNTRALIFIPYCRGCTSHYRRAGARAFESAVKLPIIGFTILLLLFQFGMLPDIVGFFLQLLVVFGSIVWGVRAYFVARAEVKNGITPACSVATTAAVIFLTAKPGGWRFRFYSRAYAEQFAAVNPGGRLETLYLD
jgi:hypothetical protein